MKSRVCVIIIRRSVHFHPLQGLTDPPSVASSGASPVFTLSATPLARANHEDGRRPHGTHGAMSLIIGVSGGQPAPAATVSCSAGFGEELPADHLGIRCWGAERHDFCKELC